MTEEENSVKKTSRGEKALRFIVFAVGMLLMLIVMYTSHIAPVIPIDCSLGNLNNDDIAILDPNPTVIPQEQFLNIVEGPVIAVLTSDKDKAKITYYAQSQPNGSYDIVCQKYVGPKPGWHLWYRIHKVTISEAFFSLDAWSIFVFLLGLALAFGASFYPSKKS